MKIYKYITLFLIFLTCLWCGYECLTTLSTDANWMLGITVCCFALVLVVDMKDTKKGKKKNAKVQGKS